MKAGSNKPQNQENAVGSFDVAKLCGRSVDDRGELRETSLFQGSVSKKVTDLETQIVEVQLRRKCQSCLL